MKMVLDMPFLKLRNIDIQYIEKKFTWRSYITAKALLITKQVMFIDKKDFAKVILDKESKTFVVHIPALEAPEMTIHPSRAIQITSSDSV